MTYQVTIPRLGADVAWRDAARGLLSAKIQPNAVIWGDATAPKELFDTGEPPPSGGQITLPRSFVSMANSVVWHSDPSRFARLYSFAWRLRHAPGLMTDRGDRDLAKLRQLEKNVHRCQHKMKAFVRFREIGDPTAARRSFAAWFEPTHHTVEPTATFFARRFADMDWRIVTPQVSASFLDGALTFTLDERRPDLPEDAGEDLWITYFRNIFNPARLKVKAMQSEMPKKYWANMPEAASIPQMIAEAPTRAHQMARAAPTLPPQRTSKVRAQHATNISQWADPSDDLPAAIAACTRCPLHCNATQSVLGEGPLDAPLMIVGEQPGDTEDLTGRPFVGPAGKLFDVLTNAAGLDRRRCYVTNAVKHFKFRADGRRRIHQRPTRSEIETCRWWLNSEIAAAQPKLILALGMTAAFSLTGNDRPIATRRGTIETSTEGTPVLITYHPSYVLRLPKGDARTRIQTQLSEDLAAAVGRLSAHISL